MKGTSFSDVAAAVSPVVVNGTHRAPRKNSPAAKHSAEARARARASSAPQPIEAPFVVTGAEPIDSPAWPLHATLWLQVERAPSFPVWTDLTIERRSRIPAPGFQPVETAPAIRPGEIETSRDALLPPPVRLELPRSGLAPLGWDPRTVCHKEGGE